MDNIIVKLDEAFSNITKTNSTPTLRWKDGILEQMWMIEEISPNPGVRFEWRIVPIVSGDDA